jgi:hypothetical protein
VEALEGQVVLGKQKQETVLFRFQKKGSDGWAFLRSLSQDSQHHSSAASPPLIDYYCVLLLKYSTYIWPLNPGFRTVFQLSDGPLHFDFSLLPVLVVTRQKIIVHQTQKTLNVKKS